MKNIIYILSVIFICSLFVLVFSKPSNHNQKIYIGGYIQTMKIEDDIKVDETEIDLNERFARPSNQSSLNNENYNYEFYDKYHIKNFKDNKIFFNDPKSMLITYFSLLREACNPVNDMGAGCGSIGDGKAPYPYTYQFLSKKYQNKLSYNDYLSSFKNILHINLIKLEKITIIDNDIKYLVELELINGNKENTGAFTYSYGYIEVVKENNGYYINNFDVIPELYLCAPYHGWNYSALASLQIKYGDWCEMIKDVNNVSVVGYYKHIYFTGTNNLDYRFDYIQLTNGYDIEVTQYMKVNGMWRQVNINPYKCLEKNNK